MDKNKRYFIWWYQATTSCSLKYYFPLISACLTDIIYNGIWVPIILLVILSGDVIGLFYFRYILKKIN